MFISNDEVVSTFLLTVSTATVGMIVWIVKRIFARLDKIDERIDSLEHEMITSEDLERMLEPMRETMNLILKHILENSSSPPHLALQKPSIHSRK